MNLSIANTESKIAYVTREELKAFRAKNNYSQDDLAKHLRVARNTVARWESGTSKIPEFLELALKTVELDNELTDIVRKIAIEASENGRIVTENEIIEKLDEIPRFWDKQRAVEILRKIIGDAFKPN